jgi:hypothetical protein
MGLGNVSLECQGGLLAVRPLAEHGDHLGG